GHLRAERAVGRAPLPRVLRLRDLRLTPPPHCHPAKRRACRWLPTPCPHRPATSSPISPALHTVIPRNEGSVGVSPSAPFTSVCDTQPRFASCRLAQTPTRSQFANDQCRY